MLGAALITASVGHGLLCLATLPGLTDAPHEGFIGGAGKVLGILWTIAGALAAAYVAMQTLSFFGGKDYAKAKTASLGTLLLPLVGLTGGITAFALVPIGAAGWWLLRKPSWQAGFAEFAPPAQELELMPEYPYEEEPAVAELEAEELPEANEVEQREHVLR